MGTLCVHKGFGFRVSGLADHAPTRPESNRPRHKFIERFLKPKTSRSEDFLLQHADVGEVAIGASEVQAVADDELVRDLEAEVLDV